MNIENMKNSKLNIREIKLLVDEYKILQKKQTIYNIKTQQRTLQQYMVLEKDYESKNKQINFENLRRYSMTIKNYVNVKDKVKEKFKFTAPDINVLDILDFTYDEVRHSKFLGWLFDPEGSHAQGKLFLEIFLSKFELPMNCTHDANYIVKLEDSGEKSRIDIVIYKRKSFMICIENKVHSSEGKDQTKREYEDALNKTARYDINVKNLHCLFLTINGEQPEDKHFGIITWYDIVECIRMFIEETKAVSTKIVVSQYLKSIRKNIIKSRRKSQNEI